MKYKGISEQAALYSADDDLYQSVREETETGKVDCVFVDEAQFLTAQQVLLDAALAHTGGHRGEAAQRLGLGRNTVTRKLGPGRKRH